MAMMLLMATVRLTTYLRHWSRWKCGRVRSGNFVRACEIIRPHQRRSFSNRVGLRHHPALLPMTLSTRRSISLLRPLRVSSVPCPRVTMPLRAKIFNPNFPQRNVSHKSLAGEFTVDEFHSGETCTDRRRRCLILSTKRQ
jgi:hypothetical protein